MESTNIAINTLMYVVGIQTIAIVAMGKYIIKLVTDCSVERGEAWKAVTALTTAVSSLRSEIEHKAAIDYARAGLPK